MAHKILRGYDAKAAMRCLEKMGANGVHMELYPNGDFLSVVFVKSLIAQAMSEDARCVGLHSFVCMFR